MCTHSPFSRAGDAGTGGIERALQGRFYPGSLAEEIFFFFMEQFFVSIFFELYQGKIFLLLQEVQV